MAGFNWYGYVSDNGNTYAIKLNNLEALAGGFNPVAPPPATAAWPWKAKDLRRAVGINNVTLKSAKVKCSTNKNSLFTVGGSWTNTLGQSCSTRGSIGEKRPGNHLV